MIVNRATFGSHWRELGGNFYDGLSTVNVNKTVSTNMDGPVEVLVTENIRHFIRTVLLTSDLPNDTRDELRKYGGATRRSNAAANGDDARRRRTMPFQLLRSVHDMQLVKGDAATLLLVENDYCHCLLSRRSLAK